MTAPLKPGDFVLATGMKPLEATPEEINMPDNALAYDPDMLAALVDFVPTGEIGQRGITAIRTTWIRGPVASMIRFRHPDVSGSVMVREVFRLGQDRPGIQRIIVDVGSSDVRQFEQTADNTVGRLDVDDLIGRSLPQEIADPSPVYAEFFEWLWDMVVVMGRAQVAR